MYMNLYGFLQIYIGLEYILRTSSMQEAHTQKSKRPFAEMTILNKQHRIHKHAGQLNFP